MISSLEAEEGIYLEALAKPQKYDDPLIVWLE